jgi:hypothetical protein
MHVLLVLLLYTFSAALHNFFGASKHEKVSGSAGERNELVAVGGGGYSLLPPLLSPIYP